MMTEKENDRQQYLHEVVSYSQADNMDESYSRFTYVSSPISVQSVVVAVVVVLYYMKIPELLFPSSVVPSLSVLLSKKNAYALKTPHVVVFLTVILLSRFPRIHSIVIPIETFSDLVTLTFDLRP